MIICEICDCCGTILICIYEIVIIGIGRTPGGRGSVVNINIININGCIIICINDLITISITGGWAYSAYVNLRICEIDVAVVSAAGAVDGQYVVEIEIISTEARRRICEVEPRPVHIDSGVICGGVAEAVTIVIIALVCGRQVDVRIVDPCLSV